MATMMVSRGLLRPFRRDQKNDFANASGQDLYQSRAGQILGTRADSAEAAGEMRWRTEFGSRLYLLRHHRLNPMTTALAKFYAQEALGRWDPRCVVTSCTVDKIAATSAPANRALIVRVTMSVVDPNTRPVQTLASGLKAFTVLPLGT